MSQSSSDSRVGENYILRTLRFPTMNHRHVEISEAHHETFRWVFEESSHSGSPSHSFRRWLQHGHGLFWMNGKAGSGKSTLMKYIFDSDKTRDILQNWAQGSKLELAGFFFWNSGTSEQMSQVGLFRSLLHQALHKDLELVSKVFPSEWATISSAMAREEPLDPLEWSLPSLKSAFERWIRLIPTSKVCLFVDGLDEFEGDHEAMAEFFKRVAMSSSHVKICVSSRPWHVFHELFDTGPSLRLQDLTFLDIKAYVDDKLKSHHRMQALARSDPENSEELVDEIVAKASGVFLWVIIVVKSLLGGLLNRDSIEDLRRRLQDLPSDLDSLYSHMLCHVDLLYQEQTARTFTVFRMLGVERDNRSRVVTALELEFSTAASVPQTMDLACSPMSESEIKSKCDWLDIHLKTRCAGLLEIYDSTFLETTGQLVRFSNYSETPPRVGLLHRTVKEFLLTEKLSSFFSNALSAVDPYLSLLMSYTIGLKRSILLSENGRILPLCNSNIWMAVTKSFLIASSTASNWTAEHSALIDELGRAAFRMWNLDDDPWLSDPVLYFHRDPGENWNTCDKQRIWQRNFLGPAVIQGLAPYIEDRARSDNLLSTEEQNTPLLIYAVHPEYAPESQLGNLPDMIYTLLKLGADPNEKWRGVTPWEHALTHLHHTGLDQEMLEEWGYIVEIMLEKGADPDAKCTKTNECTPYLDKRTSPHSVDLVIEEIFSERLPEQETALVDKLKALRLSCSEVSTCQPTPSSDDSHFHDSPQPKSPQKFQQRPKRSYAEGFEDAPTTKRSRASGLRSFETHYLQRKRQQTEMYSRGTSYIPCRNPLFETDTLYTTTISGRQWTAPCDFNLFGVHAFHEPDVRRINAVKNWPKRSGT
jgi:hypothetical protein